MTVALLVMTDGRLDCLERTYQAAMDQLHGPISRVFIHDDTGDPDARAYLRREYPESTVIGSGMRRGFGGAIRYAWEQMKAIPERYVFHLEDDFVLTRRVELAPMIDVLDAHPAVVQLALRRQPCNPEEEAAGGVVEQWPDQYEEKTDGVSTWLEHRLFFSTNPSLYRHTLLALGWPKERNSERTFTHNILTDGTPEVDGDTARFAYWGTRESGEACTHIGKRVGTGY